METRIKEVLNLIFSFLIAQIRIISIDPFYFKFFYNYNNGFRVME
jgi:hypothetical protein